MNSRADGLPARTAPSGRGLVLALGLAATVASSPAVAAAPSDLSGGVGAEDVVGLALSHNPSLRAALLDVQSARVAVAGEEARYPFTLQVDTGVTRTESPSLGYGGGTEVGASSGASASVGVAKHLPWGTDLSLSLEGSWELTRGALSAASPSLSMGPGYLLGLRFAVTQPLLRGYGRDVNEAALQQATAQRSSAEVARDRTASELLRNALVGYWELWYAHAALDIERQSLELSKEHRDEAARKPCSAPRWSARTAPPSSPSCWVRARWSSGRRSRSRPSPSHLQPKPVAGQRPSPRPCARRSAPSSWHAFRRAAPPIRCAPSSISTRRFRLRGSATASLGACSNSLARSAP
jgi:hypothetical protein